MRHLLNLRMQNVFEQLERKDPLKFEGNLGAETQAASCRSGHTQTPRSKSARSFALGLLALSMVWSACSSKGGGVGGAEPEAEPGAESGAEPWAESGAEPWEEPDVYKVVFERNCGEDAEVFASKTFNSSGALGAFPEAPTCDGYAFAGWNAEPDGSGAFFSAYTLDMPLVVYAQWTELALRPLPTNPPADGLLPLHMELSHHTLYFSPMEDGEYHERSATFSVVVLGFESPAHAKGVKLQVENIGKAPWLLLSPPVEAFAEGSKTFNFTALYDGEDEFPENFAELRLHLVGIPEGHEYEAGAQTLHVAVVDGQTKARAIPLHKANINAFQNFANEGGLALHYRLTEDIQLQKPVPPETSNWTAIGAYLKLFTGSFDGGGHSISGLVIDEPDINYQGMFGGLGEGSLVQNIGLVDVSVTGASNVGGLVGSITGGTVHNSYATGSVKGQLSVGGLLGNVNASTVKNSYAEVDVSGNNFLGGLVGTCSQNNTVQDSYATGNVEGNGSVGGLIGMLAISTVHNSYATGNVKGSAHQAGGLVGNVLIKTEVHNSYATGNVEGNIHVGGLLGNNSTIILRNSHATGNVKGNEQVGGLIGANFSAVHSSYATGNVKGNKNVGGFVGANNNVNATVHNSYATGDVEGNENVGGLAGANSGTVQSSYATGNVEGASSVGGLVGHSNSASEVQNSVALNASIWLTENDTTLGRVSGVHAASLTNNHARSDMVLHYDNGNSTYAPTADLKDGLDTLAYGTEDFWKGLGFDFETLWQWGPNNLPILSEVGGVQTPTVQAAP